MAHLKKISKAELLSLILINNGRVEKVVLENIELTGEDIVEINSSLIFSDVSGNLTITDCFSLNSIQLRPKKDYPGLTVSIEHSAINNISVSGGKIAKLTLKDLNTNNEYGSNISISDCDLSTLTIESSNLNKIEVNRVNINERRADERTTTSITISNKSKITELILKDIQTVHKKNNGICIIESEIDILTVEDSKLKRNLVSHIGQFILDDIKIKKGLINNIGIGCIEMKNQLAENSFLEIRDVKIEGLSFEKFSNRGFVKFSGVILTVSCKKNRRNNRLLAIFKSKKDDSVEPALKFNDTKLKNVEFYSCMLGEQKSRLFFYNSDISEIKVTDTNIPWMVTYWKDKDAKRISEHEQQLVLLGQLQRIYEINNHQRKVLYYHANSLNIIRKETSIRNLPDWLALHLNYLSNFYGDSLKRAFFSTMSVSIILYSIYANTRHYEPSLHPDWRLTRYVISNYLEFLSPIHKPYFLMTAENYATHIINKPIHFDIDTTYYSNRTLMISSISKIIIAYLMYQFIQAFRKYGRKS